MAGELGRHPERPAGEAVSHLADPAISPAAGRPVPPRRLHPACGRGRESETRLRLRAAFGGGPSRFSRQRKWDCPLVRADGDCHCAAAVGPANAACRPTAPPRRRLGPDVWGDTRLILPDCPAPLTEFVHRSDPRARRRRSLARRRAGRFPRGPAIVRARATRPTACGPLASSGRRLAMFPAGGGWRRR